jgi:dTDP-glucose 4,6-dehydratase
MMNEFKRAVVTGGAGFLGQALCRALAAAGTEVVCLDNLLTATCVRAGVQVCDVCEPFEVSGPVDLVLHLASPASPADFFRYPLETLAVGSEGTRNALDLADRHDARFVLASTSGVYGDPLVSPQPESYWGNANPVGPRSVYDEAKRYAEALTAAYARADRCRAVIARVFDTYGPGMRPNDARMVPRFICQALRGKPVTVTGDGSQTRSLCYISDTVAGLLALASSSLPGPVNIGNPDEATVLSIAERIISLTGSSSPIEFVPRPQDDVTVRKPDISLARCELGWEPLVGWRDGLRETIDWFATNLEDASRPGIRSSMDN